MTEHRRHRHARRGDSNVKPGLGTGSGNRGRTSGRAHPRRRWRANTKPVPTRTLIQYTVQGGDTIGSIATQFNVTEQQPQMEQYTRRRHLAGQILRVPEGEPTDAEPFEHVVQPGETLTMIAAQYGVNFIELLSR